MACLDTSFIIDLLKGRERAINIKEKLNSSNEDITIAAPVIMELISGSQRGPFPDEEKKEIFNFISSLIILDFDKESAILAGEIEANLLSKGDIIDIEDIMIGAIAKQHNEILITRNIKHFRRIPGLKIESY